MTVFLCNNWRSIFDVVERLCYCFFTIMNIVSTVHVSFVGSDKKKRKRWSSRRFQTGRAMSNFMEVPRTEWLTAPRWVQNKRNTKISGNSLYNCEPIILSFYWLYIKKIITIIISIWSRIKKWIHILGNNFVLQQKVANLTYLCSLGVPIMWVWDWDNTKNILKVGKSKNRYNRR